MTVESGKMRTDSTEELKVPVGLRHPILLYGTVGNQVGIYTIYPKVSKHLFEKKKKKSKLGLR